MSLKARLALRVPLVTALVAALIFLPAGSFRFWQGWVFVGIFVVFNAIFIAYFYRRDPALVERRLQNKEPRREQKRFKLVWVPLWVSTLILPGLDHRFGWSVELLGNVALWLSILAWAMVAVGWLLVFHVMQINSFASAIVQVEAGQRVITDGPYRVVRHPMYTGFMLMILATPLALGSYVALLPALLLIPVLVFRIRDEERVLRQELSGYAEYCERTRFRLIPSVF